MRDYGRVYSKFWTSGDVQRMSEDARTLSLYLLTNQHGTIAGVCRLPDGYVCEDIRWPPERVAKGFEELFQKGFANRCGTTKWVWIRKHFEWNQPENPNQWKAARKIAAQVPDECVWKADFSREFAIAAGDKPAADVNPSGTVTQTVSKSVSVPVSVPVSEVPRRTFDGTEFVDKRMRPIYPRGTFQHKHWLLAARAVERIVTDQGIDPDLIVANVQAYYAQQEALGKLGGQYIRAPSRWLEEGDWRGPFPMPPADLDPRKTAEQQRQRETEQRDWSDLRSRATAAGFRAPKEGESIGAFRTLLERHEGQRNHESGGPVSVRSILARAGSAA